jgi:hypothetical protein
MSMILAHFYVYWKPGLKWLLMARKYVNIVILYLKVSLFKFVIVFLSTLCIPRCCVSFGLTLTCDTDKIDVSLCV